MAYVVEQQIPAAVTDEMYASIIEGLGEEVPAGLVCHVALRTEAGLSYVDVWRSRDDCERTNERLHPVVGRVLGNHGFTPSGEPPRSEPRVVDVWASGFRARGVSDGPPPRRRYDSSGRLRRGLELDEAAAVLWSLSAPELWPLPPA